MRNMTITQQFIDVAEQVRQQCLACGRDPHEVRLVAVSKTVSAQRVQDAIDGGARDFGENRPDQIMEKHAAYPQVNWHFIGNVQSRRIRDIVPCATLIHSVYQPSHLAKIDAAAAECGKVQDILVEVNVSGEQSKGGVTPDELPSILAEAAKFEHVRVRGLMTMAPQGSLEVAEACFAKLRELLAKHGLTGAQASGDIEWNFTKFLIDRDGNIVKRFHSTTTPEAIDAEIATLLN